VLENLTWRTAILFVAALVVVSCPLAYGVIIAVDRTYADGLVDAPEDQPPMPERPGSDSQFWTPGLSRGHE
jgi:hypothetical protein